MNKNIAMTLKKITLSILFFFSGLVLAFAQEATDSVAAPTKKPLEKKPFESGIFVDYQTVEVPTAKTL